MLTPAIEKICAVCLRLTGLDGGVQVMWDDIMLQDMVEQARAQLLTAQAENFNKEDV